jgi:hypothetical protein
MFRHQLLHSALAVILFATVLQARTSQFIDAPQYATSARSCRARVLPGSWFRSMRDRCMSETMSAISRFRKVGVRNGCQRLEICGDPGIQQSE